MKSVCVMDLPASLSNYRQQKFFRKKNIRKRRHTGITSYDRQHITMDVETPCKKYNGIIILLMEDERQYEPIRDQIYYRKVLKRSSYVSW